MIIPSSLILEAIKKLEGGKSAGPNGVYAESIKFAHHRLHIYFLFVLVYVLHMDIRLRIRWKPQL